MAKEEILSVRVEECHMNLLDSLIPHFGSNRSEVVRQIIFLYLDQRFDKEELQAIGAIQSIKIEKTKPGF
jgi:metal-responsive CopG/Arc/MetJ family transcriptional regulator